MSYTAYQSRPTSQPPPPRRDYYTGPDIDGRAASAQAAAHQSYGYSDRGRVFAQRPWQPPEAQDLSRSAPRSYAPPPYAENDRGPANEHLSPYYQRYEVERYRRRPRHSRSNSQYRSKSRGRHHRNRSRSSSRSSRSAESGFDRVKHSTQDALGKTFDTRAKGITAGVVGALIGSAIGKRAGDGHDKNHALAGAIIGGLGLNALENQVHRSRERKREERFYEDKFEYRPMRSRRRSSR